MKRAGLVLLVAAGLAFAGTNFAISGSASLPTRASDGVSLQNATSCRGMVYFTDGGTIMGGTLQPYYYNTNTPWMQGPRALACTLDTTYQIDGGSRKSQICEWTVANPYGRASVVATGLIGEDGGPVISQLRTECWGGGSNLLPINKQSGSSQ